MHGAYEMSKRKGQQVRSQLDSLHEQGKARALDQARKVPWRRLAAAVDQANHWEAFGLWLRAVVDAAKNLPPLVDQQLEAKIPGFLARVEADMRAALKKDAPGHRLWNLVSSWTAVNIFLEPKVQGWLDAVHYFSSMSLPYMKAWAHWDRVHEEWRTNPPAEWPTFERWQDDIAAVTKLANRDSVPQQVLDSVRSVSSRDWERLFSTFSDLMAFSQWMELMLDLEGPRCRLVCEEVRVRYHGFAFSDSALSSGEAVRELNTWVLDREFKKGESLIAALSWHVQHHPAYYAVRNYAIHCHAVWSVDYPGRLPSFDEWRKAADAHTS